MTGGEDGQRCGGKMDRICLCYYSLSSLERKSRYFLFYLIRFYVF